MPVGPYSQDALKRTFNVQWDEEGLAVEFTGRPSYLTLARQVSMNKATISFWFRIPSESALIRGGGVVPLLMFGSQQSGLVYDWEGGVIGYIPSFLPDGTPAPVPIYGTYIVGSHTEALPVSAIGVRFYDGTAEGSLDINIQTANLATGANLAVETPSATWEPGWNPDNPDDQINYHYVDASYTETTPQENLGNSFYEFFSDEKRRIPIKVDEWHHILISWDLHGSNSVHGQTGGASTAAGTDAYSLLWCAIDDENKDKYQLPARWIGGWGYGSEEVLDVNPNAMLSDTCYKYAGHDGPVSRLFSAPPEVSVSFSELPSNPIIVPGGPGIADNDLVEMAELQIFSGVALDTSIVKNRRAFIDFERNAAGDPVEDSDGHSTLKPVDPAKSEELIGTKPVILLHGTENWKTGSNTGSMEKIPEGQFTPTGEINSYPDPSIQK
jgi:hypothetical protein